MIFTIHFGGKISLFLVQHPYLDPNLGSRSPRSLGEFWDVGMSQMNTWDVPGRKWSDHRWSVSVGYFTYLINGIYWGYNPLILTIYPNFLGHPIYPIKKSRWNNPLIPTIDPNFQRDIQVELLPGIWTASLPLKIGWGPQKEAGSSSIIFQRRTVNLRWCMGKMALCPNKSAKRHSLGHKNIKTP